MDRLDAARIDIPGAKVRVLARCESTNSVLLESGAQAPVLLACERQSAGRGRRGRRWHSAPGASITFSLARAVRRPVRELAALSLVAGVAAAKALRGLGAREVELKWPNDLVVGSRKLGGILVETRPQDGATLAVVGLGLNWRPGALSRRLRRPVDNLARLLRPLPSRNAIIERIGQALLDALDRFEARGLDAVRSDWEAMDAHAGRRLRVRLADGRVVSGIASGLAADGGLRLRTRSGVRAITSGRVVRSRTA